MPDNNIINKYKAVFIRAGQVCLVNKPYIVWTVLGSCVSVVLFNKRTKFGAICHGQLPYERNTKCKCTDSCPDPCGLEWKKGRFLYVDNSVEYMINYFNKSGILNNEIEASVYGGASVILQSMKIEDTAGYKNLKVAFEILKKYNIKIIKKDVGGNEGRTIYYYSDTGITKVRMQKSDKWKNYLNDSIRTNDSLISDKKI